jgi:hypothetical protein
MQKAYEDLTLEEQIAEVESWIADTERFESFVQAHGRERTEQLLEWDRETLRQLQEELIDRNAPARRQEMSLVK